MNEFITRLILFLFLFFRSVFAKRIAIIRLLINRIRKYIRPTFMASNNTAQLLAMFQAEGRSYDMKISVDLLSTLIYNKYYWHVFVMEATKVGKNLVFFF